MSKKNVLLSASMMGLFAAAGTVNAQVILCPESLDDVVYVLDATTGDQIGSFDISSFAQTPIECIDGPGGTLLISDQLGDMVYQLDSSGNLLGNYLTATIDNLRGIEILSNGLLVGATTNGLFTWDLNGDQTNLSVVGDFFDAMGDFPGILVATEIDNDNAVGFSTKNGRKIGETPTGQADFPEQCARIKTANGARLAVCTFTGDSIFVYNLDGSLDYSFGIGTSGRGVIQIGNGNLLVSTGSAISEYTVDGQLVRNVVTDGSFRFFSVSNNYQ